MKDKEGDVSQLSAFAVYNKLIPGVKSYTQNSDKSSKKKKKKQNAKKNELDLQRSSSASPSVSKINQNANKSVLHALEKETFESNVSADSTPGAGKRKRKRKRKLQTESHETGIAVEPISSKIAKIVHSPKAKKVKANDLPLFLPNPVALESLNKAKKTKSAVSKKISSTDDNKHNLPNGNNSISTSSSSRQKKLPLPVVSRSVTFMSEEEDVDKSISSILNRKPVWNSIEHGKSLFEWLISPISVNTFMTEYWEKKPLHIPRSQRDSDSDYFKWIISSEKIDNILRRNVLKYQKNIDITSFSKSNNVRETQSDELEGRARPAVVWDYYNNGCSIRILNPQTYIKPLWRLSASLQEWFGSFVGANAYLTPPDSQGFAPHYDDIEAFIIQVEGKKHWKLYKPRSKNEELPRFSSNNFSEEKDNLGKPIFDAIVEEGDLLYFPRGTIHQAMASEEVHSLHITLSCQQKNTWGDLLKEHLNNAVDKAMASDIEFRRGLPTDYLSYMGIAHQDNHDNGALEKRKKFAKTVKHLIDKLSNNPADFAADQMGKKFVWDSLPPYLSAKEKEVTVNEDGEFIQGGVVFNRCEMDPDVEIKLVRKNCIRLVVEEGVVRLYFTTENPLVYHEEEAQYLEMSAKTAPAVQYLISRYPEYVKIDDMPISADDVSEKVQIAVDLWERGLLMTRTPLEAADDVGDFDSEDAESIGSEDSELEVPDMDDNYFGDSNDEVESDEESDSDADDYFDFGNSVEVEESESEDEVPIVIKRKAKK